MKETILSGISLPELDQLLNTAPGHAAAVAGVNQTLHRMTLDVHAVLTVSMPRHTVQRTLQYDVCIAETIIVGTVPDFYANIEHGE